MTSFQQKYMLKFSPIKIKIQYPQKPKQGLQFGLSSRNKRERYLSGNKTIEHRKPSFSENINFSNLIFRRENLQKTTRTSKENTAAQRFQLSFQKIHKLKLKKKKDQVKICKREDKAQDSLQESQQTFYLGQNNLFYGHFSPKSIAQASTSSESLINSSKSEFKKYPKIQDYVSQIQNQPLKISDFELGECIGSGKFGDVHICRHKKTNFIFGLKKILKNTIIENKMLEQLIIQLKIQYSLNHQNIVKLYAHFDDEYHIFLLMEYAPGGTLMSHIYNTESYTSQVLQQMLKAVSYIHQKKIIHRDIKPENIVIYFDNTFKLCDFGLSAYLKNNDDSRTSFCGTLDYIAPQMKNKGLYNFSVDIWGLGVLCYEVLFGKAPFKQEIANWKKRGAKRHSNWNWNINFPSYASEASLIFILNLLKENPNQRMGLVSALQSSFIAYRKKNQNLLTQREEQILKHN